MEILETFIVITLVVLYFGVTVYAWQIRGELKQTEYWEKLPSGTAILGYCLPVLILILGNEEHPGFIRIFLGILLVFLFICSVAGINSSLKEKPLEGYSSVLPDDARKKIVLFYALTPIIAISVLAFIAIILDFIFGVMDYMKRKTKK